MAITVLNGGKTFEFIDGQWVNTHTQTVAPSAVRHQLNAEFVKQFEQSCYLAKVVSTSERRAWFDFLREKMSMSLEKLYDMGFQEDAIAANPELAIRLFYRRTEAPAGRSFANCPRLRDRFFVPRPLVVFDLPVAILGGHPFERSDFEKFLLTRGIALCQTNEPVHALIIGRTDWQNDDVDSLIEAANGSVLRIYSQEMFVSVMAGQPDPFKTWPLTERLWDLYAFRAGHSGLEYVSQGWAGWVKGFGSNSSVSWDDGANDFIQVEQSPLHVMGYKVGETGVSEEERRQILRAAFLHPLPFVQSPAYMEEWGDPGTGPRLRRIAVHLARNIEKNGLRANLRTAVGNWASDLNWLKDTFYRSVYAFNWPQA